MVLARQADEWAVILNRQGRMPTYPPNKGQEANAVGSILALREENWLLERSCLSPSSLIIGSATAPMQSVSSTASWIW